MKKMNINKNKLKHISFLTLVMWVGALQQAGAQGLKLQGMSAPGADAVNLSNPVSAGQAGTNSGKSGLRSTSQPKALKTEGAPLEEPSGVGSLLEPGQTAAELEKEYSDFIVAIVDSEPITNREVNQRAQEHLEQIKQQGTLLPPRDTLLSKTLEELILEKAQLQIALETGLGVTDDEVLQAQLGIAERNGITLEQLYAQLRLQGQSVEQYKTRLRQQMILQKLRDREVLSKVRITDLEADQFLLEQQKKGASTSQLINLSQILISVPDGTADAQLGPYQTKASEILQKIKAGADFSELAKTNSDALDSKNGGVMGLRPESRYPSLFINAIKNTKVGQVVGPIRSGAGLHILLVNDRQQGDGEAAFVTQTHSRHILLRPGSELSQNAARAKLAEFKRKIERGESDFALLAKEFSQDGSASAGGDLGWASPGQFVPEFEAVMGKLSPGQIADPFISRFGVHLIQVLERKQAPISLKERRDAARKIMQDKKFEESYSNWEREVRGHAFIEYKDAPL